MIEQNFLKVYHYWSNKWVVRRCRRTSGYWFTRQYNSRWNWMLINAKHFKHEPSLPKFTHPVSGCRLAAAAQEKLESLHMILWKCQLISQTEHHELLGKKWKTNQKTLVVYSIAHPHHKFQAEFWSFHLKLDINMFKKNPQNRQEEDKDCKRSMKASIQQEISQITKADHGGQLF